MTAVFYTELNCDYVYRFVIARFEFMGNTAVVLSVVPGKSLTEEKRGKIRPFFGLRAGWKANYLNINKFKIVVHNLLYDPMNYVGNK